ncbi:MAG: hypothetical protein WKF42_08065 [Solirubrobacteraceae bacterium]
MSAERRISDEDLGRLRHLADEGVPTSDLAAAFGVTVQHVRRLLRGEQRASIAGLDPDVVRADVVRAVDEFLEDADLSAADGVRAATARVLARKLDACASSVSAAAAAATPRLAAELVSVLAVLQDGAPRELDEVDALQARRATRLLAMAASADFPKPDQRRSK